MVPEMIRISLPQEVKRPRSPHALLMIVWLATLLFFPQVAHTSQLTLCNEAKKAGLAILSDFKEYYSLTTLCKTTIGMGVSGIIANTEADEDIQEWVQDDVRSEETDHFSKTVKELGNWQRVAPLYLALAASGTLFNGNGFMRETGGFGEKSFRALLVGMPAVLFWQFSLGASRPSDQKESRWHPGEDNNSVSGHAFTGAVPFLTAARMSGDPYLKSFLYLGSTATAFSRINDDQHYFSQAILGWWFAFLAVESVDRMNKNQITFSPMVIDDGFGIVGTFIF
jgi:hypothetical protein